MADRIFEAFLMRQLEEGAALAASSDLLELMPLESDAGGPPDRYVATFRCKGLVRTEGAGVRECDFFQVGVWFPANYLREANPFEVLTWLGPREVFHPNIGDGAPFICVGRLNPGTPLVELLYRCFEIINYTRVTMREDDALNRAACAWARENRERFPLDRRPLKRRRLKLEVAPAGERLKEEGAT